MRRRRRRTRGKGRIGGEEEAGEREGRGGAKMERDGERRSRGKEVAIWR